jgi:hypothetical protein
MSKLNQTTTDEMKNILQEFLNERGMSSIKINEEYERINMGSTCKRLENVKFYTINIPPETFQTRVYTGEKILKAQPEKDFHRRTHTDIYYSCQLTVIPVLLDLPYTFTAGPLWLMWASICVGPDV